MSKLKNNVKSKMEKARDLIRDKRYAEARVLLESIDHPTAEKWLERLDEKKLGLPPRIKRRKSTRRGRIIRWTLIGTFGCCISLYALQLFGIVPSSEEFDATDTAQAIVAQAATSTAAASLTPTLTATLTDAPTVTPSSTITNTPEPTLRRTIVPDSDQARISTAQNVLVGVYRDVPGLNEIVYANAYESDNGSWEVVMEVNVNNGLNSELMADTLRLISQNRLIDFELDFMVIIDDGNTVSDYIWLGNERMWQITHLSQSTPTTRPSQNNTTTRRPQNCDDARAMGLSAVEAGRWDHLDRDDDGVACYGD